MTQDTIKENCKILLHNVLNWYIISLKTMQVLQLKWYECIIIQVDLQKKRMICTPWIILQVQVQQQLWLVTQHVNLIVQRFNVVKNYHEPLNIIIWWCVLKVEIITIWIAKYGLTQTGSHIFSLKMYFGTKIKILIFMPLQRARSPLK